MAARGGRPLAPGSPRTGPDGLALDDLDADWTASLAKAAQTAASNTDATAAPRATTAARPAFPTAWIKAATQGPLQSATLSGGWKAVEMTLNDGDGTVTIQARRDQDAVSVSIGFSEPRMQAQAAANARQIQEALQAQYDADVDLSFAGGDPDGSDEQTHHSSSRDAASSRPSPAEENAGEDPSPQRRSGDGSRREWVG